MENKNEFENFQIADRKKKSLSKVNKLHDEAGV